MAKAAKKAVKKSEKAPAKVKVATKPAKEVVKAPAKKKSEPPVSEETFEVKDVVGQDEVPCPEPELGSTEFDEMLIKEIMVQKNVTRLGAIDVLRNPQ